MISPPLTVCPANRFTPRRLAFESRPLREDPSPFLCAILVLRFRLTGLGLGARARGLLSRLRGGRTAPRGLLSRLRGGRTARRGLLSRLRGGRTAPRGLLSRLRGGRTAPRGLL